MNDESKQPRTALIASNQQENCPQMKKNTVDLHQQCPKVSKKKALGQDAGQQGRGCRDVMSQQLDSPQRPLMAQHVDGVMGEVGYKGGG